MNDDKHDETPQPQAQRLLHWDRIDWVTMNRHIQAREPTCLEWVVGVTLANAVSVANAPFCGDDTELDVPQVIRVVAEKINAGMLDDTILLLRDVLKHCIRRGDSSLFAAKSADEEDMDCVVG